MSAELFLLFNGFELLVEGDVMEAITMDLARGECRAEELAIWLRQRLEPIAG